jgi:hypothetical protein
VTDILGMGFAGQCWWRPSRAALQERRRLLRAT